MMIGLLRRNDGGAAAEFVIVGPIILMFALAVLQLTVIFFAQLSLLTTARDVARWVSVNPHTIDASAVTAVRARVPSDIDSSLVNVAMTPTCAALVQNKCPNRAAGQDIAVSVTYTITSLYFLPTLYRFGPVSIQFPTTLPPYVMHIQAEPSA